MEKSRFTAHLYNYLPSRYEATAEEERVRQLIWGFKDGIRNISILAAERVASELYRHLFSRDVIFVCIPASTELKNDRRYELFSSLVARSLGIEDGFTHIRISGERLAIHESRHNKILESVQVIEFDNDFFAGRDVVVFDDIYTTGGSCKRFTAAIESIGARVIGSIFLGKTISI